MLAGDWENWNAMAAGLPGAHLFQTEPWAQVKQAYGWQAQPLRWPNAAAVVLRRNISLTRFGPKASVLYLPRGPLLDWNDLPLRQKVLDELQLLARRSGVIFIKIDPEVILGRGIPGSEQAEECAPEGLLDDLKQRGWWFSPEQIQFRNTVWLDLRPSEEEWLARMKQKTRYNIRLAQKKEVTVRRGSEADFDLLYRMYAETSLRDGFVIRPREYYETVWRNFIQAGMAQPLIAEVEGAAVAGLFLFTFAQKAWYLYGMSRDAHREKMPNYLLQWEAMRAARAAGCLDYDLWGAPDIFDESDSMWGVYRFKEGLGGTVVRTLGAWDYTARPALYALYTRVLPRVLDIMRRRGKARAQREVSV
ncbi:MAG TPA: peptidoglycan bridge formation glycyltransferase FemA/FemB family protein [Anaerolineaceae bacterium]|nr:peptidoglycan bridge formation glycyltransferase FemA/FemB family protein [Anaerolineaceae bacterium]